MVGTVQVGLLAAFIVLFVPMGMAGWHLSRNKMLFFGGVLFITLAVGVHLIPYLPSVAQFIPTLSAPPTVESQRSCLSFLHEIEWERGKGLNSSSWTWNWARSAPVEVCAFQKVERSEAFNLLNGSWVFVAGDSQARLLVLALLHLVLDEKAMEAVEGDLYKMHSNYQIVIHEHGMKVDFVWAPYESNLTEVVENLKDKIRLPEVMVLGSGLWHMLHLNNASDYGHQLCLLKVSMAHPFQMSEFSTFSMQSSHAFWLGMPTLVNSLLNTEEKKERMNIFSWEAYYQEFFESKLLHDSGGPLVLLDMASLTRKCGLGCTSDGMHYDGIVYEAALQVLLNALLIESQQLM